MSGYERSKAPLALMEQIIMILVFAIASAVCLQAFVYSDNLSKKGDRTEMAANRAQTVTEYCKDKKGNLDAVCELLGGKLQEKGLVISYEEEEIKLTLQVTESTPYMEKALIRVQEEDGEELYNMEVAWQKEGTQ